MEWMRNMISLHEAHNLIPFFGAVIRGDRRGTPVITRWIENIILTGGGIILALYVNDKINTDHISTNLDAIKSNTARIEHLEVRNVQQDDTTRQELDDLRTDIRRQIEPVQRMLSDLVSRK